MIFPFVTVKITMSNATHMVDAVVDVYQLDIVCTVHSPFPTFWYFWLVRTQSMDARKSLVHGYKYFLQV